MNRKSLSTLYNLHRTFMTQSVVQSPIKSVAIIGSGPSGAGAAKAFIKENAFDNIKIFEKRSQFGGLWNYTLETDNSTTPIPSESSNFDVLPNYNKETGEYSWASPVYDFLDTNVPKDIMTYADTSFPEELPVFPHRSEVLTYLKKYCQELTPYVKFETKVIDVKYLSDVSKWQVTSRPIVKQTNGGQSESTDINFKDEVENFDAVVIATGNYDIPYIPNRLGMKEWHAKYPGSISHVKSFRNPDQFKDIQGEILIVGNSASAGDLSYQLATTLNRKIFKSKRSENMLPAGQNELIIDLPDIEKFDSNNKLIIFKDGSTLENVDKVMFATGYLKSFPFMNLPEDKPPLLTDGHKVHGIYEHVILYNYPNLAIVGLARFVLPTRTSETQGCWLSKIWSNKIKLPDLTTMKNWEQKRIEIKGNGKQFHDLLYPEDVVYCNELNNQILTSIKNLPKNERGLIPKIWDKEQTALRGSIKNIKEAYIQYKFKTGKLAKNYQELIDSKIIDQILISDEELKELGFHFDEKSNDEQSSG